MTKTRGAGSMTHNLAAFESAYLDRRRAWVNRFTLSLLALLALFTGTGIVGRVNPNAIAELPHFFDYIKDMIPVLRPATFGADLAAWYWNLGIWVSALVDTVLIAILGTSIGAGIAFVFSFLASRNLVPPLVYWLTRRFMELMRGIPELLYAMLFVWSYGLGALPGVLAVSIHTAGTLGKLFAEINENASMEELEGVRSAGGSWIQQIRYGLVPQVLPGFISYILLRFEINIRSASIIGFVGAGGIGQILITAIRQFRYTDISALTLMLIGIVMLLDRGCEALRHRILGEEIV